MVSWEQGIMFQWCWWEGGWVDVDRYLRRSTQGCDRCTSDCHPLHCSPTLPSLHPAVNFLTTSCSCKTDNKNDRILQMDCRLKKVSTTLHKRHKRRPDALCRTPAKGVRTGMCWARDFPCCIPAMAKTTILHRALTQWRTNTNYLHFIRAQQRLGEKLIIVPAFSAATRLTLIEILYLSMRVHTRNQSNHYVLAWKRR